MGSVSIRTCDCCGKHLIRGIGVVQNGTIVKLNDSTTVILPAGEYCEDCVAKAVGHECPAPPLDDDP